MEQAALFVDDDARSLIDQLLTDSKLYYQSKSYKELLDFVVRLRNFAPFNAMLLNMQKPGLRYAASAQDWKERFGRTPMEGARPLIILWPFGPVALVYDVQDTEGDPLPQDVASFFAIGSVDARRIETFIALMSKQNIAWRWVDAGDQNAGSIRVVKRGSDKKKPTTYRIHINKNHTSAVQFTTLAHELAHLFLGHLGPDKMLSVPERPVPGHAQKELEAESVAYLVCARNDIVSKSETYLKDYIISHTTVEDIDLYQVMRAAGQVEKILGLASSTRFNNSKRATHQESINPR